MRSVIDLKAIDYTTTQPLSRNKKGLLVQKPYIEIVEGDDTYYIYGKDIMWSYFDALFWNDRLPRPVVEDDIFAPTTTTPSLYQLLREFTFEAIEDGNRYIVVEHDDEGIVKMFSNLSDRSKKFDDLEALQNHFIGHRSTLKPLLYKSKKGNNIVPALLSDIGASVIVVYDLGRNYYFAWRSFSLDGHEVGMIEPTVVAKTDSTGIFNIVKRLTEECMNHTIPHGIGRPVKRSDFTTREYDILLHQRLGVRI
jgi:hypothetical protein